MLDLPGELQDTVRLLYVTTYNPKVRWPSVDEDQISVHSRSWIDAANSLMDTVSSPTMVPGTIWFPTTHWDFGHDKPLDAFTSFWKNHPLAHYMSAANQVTAVAIALNNIAGIITVYKMAFINIASLAKDSRLSWDYHALGVMTRSFFGSSGSEAEGNLRNQPGETLAQVAPNERADRLAQDQTLVNFYASALETLCDQATVSIAAQREVITTATQRIGNIENDALRSIGSLPDQSYSKSDPEFSNPDPWDELRPLLLPDTQN